MTHLTGFPCPLVRSVSRRGAALHKRSATPRAVKGSRPSVVPNGPPGVLRPLPDAGASRCGPRLPGGPLDIIKWVTINEPWYKDVRQEAH
jgi:hypothetical protein